VRGRKGTYQAVFEEIRKAGFVRARVDGTVHSLDDEISLDRYKQHDIDAVVDRLVISHEAGAEDLKSARSRLTDSSKPLKPARIYCAMRMAKTEARAQWDRSGEATPRPALRICRPVHGISLPEIELHLPFNTPHGARPDAARQQASTIRPPDSGQGSP
jgi:excinuclease ABC subunit A